MLFRGQYFFLSNFYPCSVLFDGNSYPTAEHAYQCAKARDHEGWRLVRNASSPGKAKAAGQRIPKVHDWNDIRLDVMRRVLRAKFRNPDLVRALLDTGDIELVEDNTWNDRFWGRYQGVGENWLGRLLMELREELRGE